jgi:small subunit ribosomal protein S9
VTVNKKSIDEYFGRDVAKMIVRQPLVLTKNAEAYDVDAKVQGGGSFGQAGAIRLAISKALLEEDPELRAELKKAGYLTRDSRVKERKKVGLKKARKSPQFSKR